MEIMARYKLTESEVCAVDCRHLSERESGDSERVYERDRENVRESETGRVYERPRE